MGGAWQVSQFEVLVLCLMCRDSQGETKARRLYVQEEDCG